MLLLPYHFLWTLPIFLGLPIIGIIKKGRVADRLAMNLPKPLPGENNIWIHALSVGEVLSALPLVDALKLKFPKKGIIFTSTTSRGLSIAREKLQGKVDVITTMPVDSWWCIRRIVNFIKPSVFLLVETDIWPALINHLKRKGVKCILVNGRISPRTFNSYRKFAPVARMLFADLELCLMQTDLDRDRLLTVGIDPDKVKTVGNIKFDRDWVSLKEDERQILLRELGLTADYPLWVAGSTHPGEEEIILRTYKKLKTLFPGLCLIIAPRKTERGDEIAETAKKMGLKAILRTDISDSGEQPEVLVLNTLGELDRVYGLASVSFVGGSMVPFGGHNMLEPAGFGCPVVYGTHTDNFVLMADLLEECGGGWRVSDEDGLHDVMKNILGHTDTRLESGASAKKFLNENKGALGRIINHISKHLT